MRDATNEFREMMKDLMFGQDGLFKDLPEEQKAAGIDFINSTTIVDTESGEAELSHDKKYQVFALSEDGRYLLSIVEQKNYLTFYGTESEALKLWDKLRYCFDFAEELGFIRNINLVDSIHCFDSQEDMQEYIDERWG